MMQRRTFLRGLGASVALPWLESWAPEPAASKAQPLRLVWAYVPNGIHMPDWHPEADGAWGASLPPTLQTLESFRDELRLLRGLTQDKARANGDGPGDHARAASVWLTGVQPLKTDGQVHLATSADQLAADSIGRETRFRSLVLGAEGGRTSGQCDSGYACAYSNHISWSGPKTPCGKETQPTAVFDRLFRGGVDARSLAAQRERQARRRSVLDAVRGDAKDLVRRVSQSDRQRLDEYLEGVRELERRIELRRPAVVEEVPDSARPEATKDFDERVSLLLELTVLALRTDSTRVATVMLANEGSNRSYNQLEISEGHHTLSHHGKDPEKQHKIARINRHHVSLMKPFFEALRGAKVEGDSLLDHTAVVYGGGIADGNRHAHHDLPIALVGGQAHLSLPAGSTSWPKNTPLNNLHLGLLQRAGVSVDKLGDSSGVIEV